MVLAHRENGRRFRLAWYAERNAFAGRLVLYEHYFQGDWIRCGPCLLLSNLWYYNRQGRDGRSWRIRLCGKILHADAQGISDVPIPLKLARGGGQTVNLISRTRKKFREYASWLWKAFVVYLLAGAGIAHLFVDAIGWSPILWEFPPPDEVHTLAYLIVIFVGLCYGMFAVGVQLGRRTPPKCKQPACPCAKCCRCKPAGS